MAVIDTGLLTKGLRSEFFERLDQVPSFFERLAMRIVSGADKETYRWLGAVPNMREWGTGRKVQGFVTSEYIVTNGKYEATIEVNEDELEDDQTGQIRIRVAELAQRAGSFKDQLVTLLMEQGGDAGSLAYDGKSFYASDHAVGESGTMDNDLSFDVATPSAPTTAELKTVFQKMIQQLRSFKDEQGVAVNTSLSGLLFVIPPNWEFNAREALNATIIANTTNILVGAADLLVNPHMSNNDRCYLNQVGEVVRPFVYQERNQLVFAALDQETDEPLFMNGTILYGVKQRFKIAYGRFQKSIRGVLT